MLPPHRGQGIGTELVRRLLAELEGLYPIDLVCDAELAAVLRPLRHAAAASDGAPPPMTGLGGQITRLAQHSAIYGLGGLVSRFVALLLLPLYTRYLTPADYGAVETLVALAAILATILRLGIASAFFRFYFDSTDAAHRLRVVCTSFWFTMAMATIGLVAGLAFAGQISEWLFDTDDRTTLVRMAFVLLWAQMNFEQMTALFRVEERAVAFTIATLANLVITVGATVVFVVVLDWGATGVIAGNFTGTLVVYAALLVYRHEQLGLTLDRPLLRRMNHFGLPLVPSMLGALDAELRRPLLHPQARGRERGGRLLDRLAHRIGDGAAPDGIPRGVARVRILDRGRRARAAGVLLRAHVPAVRRLLGSARPGAA